MQTFMTNASFYMCAQALDNKRLGKQRVEAYQILRVLKGLSKGWKNHPAVLMWVGHEAYLSNYIDFMCEEWKKRGFKDSVSEKARLLQPWTGGAQAPQWWSDPNTLSLVTASHRSNLLRKDPDHYGKFGWKEPNDLPYFWPVTKADLELRRVLDFCP